MTRDEADALFPHEKHFPHTGKLLEAFEQAKAYAYSLGLSRPAGSVSEDGTLGPVSDPDGTILPGTFKYLLDVTLRWRDRAG